MMMTILGSLSKLQLKKQNHNKNKFLNNLNRLTYSIKMIMITNLKKLRDLRREMMKMQKMSILRLNQNTNSMKYLSQKFIRIIRKILMKHLMKSTFIIIKKMSSIKKKNKSNIQTHLIITKIT